MAGLPVDQGSLDEDQAAPHGELLMSLSSVLIQLLCRGWAADAGQASNADWKAEANATATLL